MRLGRTSGHSVLTLNSKSIVILAQYLHIQETARTHLFSLLKTGHMVMVIGYISFISGLPRSPPPRHGADNRGNTGPRSPQSSLGAAVGRTSDTQLSEGASRRPSPWCIGFQPCPVDLDMFVITIGTTVRDARGAMTAAREHKWLLICRACWASRRRDIVWGGWLRSVPKTKHTEGPIIDPSPKRGPGGGLTFAVAPPPSLAGRSTECLP